MRLDVTTTDRSALTPRASSASNALPTRKRTFFNRKCRLATLSGLARSWNAYLVAGLSLQASLRELPDDLESDSYDLAVLLDRTRDLVDREGRSVAECLEAHRELLGDLFVSLFQVGETTGTLDDQLAYLADALEEEEAIRRGWGSAFYEPLGILVAAIVVAVIIIFFSVPQFIMLYATFGVKDLPRPTQFLIDLYNFFTSWTGIAVVTSLVGAGGLGWTASRKSPALRRFLDERMLRVPLLGQLTLEYNLMLGLRTLSICLRAGVTYDKALPLAALSVPNLKVKELFTKATDIVLEGKQLNVAFTLAGFPKRVLTMTKVGEDTSAPDVQLAHLAKIYGANVVRLRKRALGILNPTMKVISAAIVFFIMLAIYLPIWNLIQYIR